MASMTKPVRLTSAPGASTPMLAPKVPGVSSPTPAEGYRSSEKSRSIPLPQVANVSHTKDEDLIDALQASQAANDALEAVIKLQARAIEQMMRENKKLCKQLTEVHGKTHPTRVTCDASTQFSADEATVCSLLSTLDASVQTVAEGNHVSTAQTALDVPQSSPRIQPPVVPPTPRRLSKSQKEPTPKGSPRLEAPSCLNMDQLTKVNDSPYMAEAFRLGWLAGVKSNSMATNKSPSSTRSDDSQPSDPGSYIMDKSGSESGESRGSESPLGPGDKLPALPTMMPPPPPPAVLVPPPAVPFEQLG